MFWSFGDFVWLVEILEKCLAISGSTGVFVNTWKIFWSFGGFVWLLEILEKCSATSGSTGLFVITWKNILKLWGLCRAFIRSQTKISTSLTDILEICLAISGSTGVFVDTWKNNLKLWGLCRVFWNSRKMFSKYSTTSFFQVSTNTPLLLEVAKHISRISRCPTKSPKLQNIF